MASEYLHRKTNKNKKQTNKPKYFPGWPCTSMASWRPCLLISVDLLNEFACLGSVGFDERHLTHKAPPLLFQVKHRHKSLSPLLLLCPHCLVYGFKCTQGLAPTLHRVTTTPLYFRVFTARGLKATSNKPVQLECHARLKIFSIQQKSPLLLTSALQMFTTWATRS